MPCACRTFATVVVSEDERQVLRAFARAFAGSSSTTITVPLDPNATNLRNQAAGLLSPAPNRPACRASLISRRYDVIPSRRDGLLRAPVRLSSILILLERELLERSGTCFFVRGATHVPPVYRDRRTRTTDAAARDSWQLSLDLSHQS